MRWSQTLIPTLKETPAEAEIISHKLLLRAGIIRKLTGGLYTFLPLGVLSLRKIEQIVREEMNRAGALEVLMPALQPPEIWQQTGRYETLQDVLFKVRDRAKKDWVLGPTHEEVITTLVAGEVSSYRQMPKNFYQIQVKFRDEIRPRFGLMRAKEFIMKDAYSFDATDELAQESYRRMYDAYARIFQRCGLKTIAVGQTLGRWAVNFHTNSWCRRRLARTRWCFATLAATRQTLRKPPAMSQRALPLPQTTLLRNLPLRAW